LEAKKIGSLFLASKIQNPKKHLFRCFFWLLPKPKSQKKPQQKGPKKGDAESFTVYVFTRSTPYMMAKNGI
jgi:hypothetical protein